MSRIQVSLDKKDYALVRKEAKLLGIPTEEFVRRAVRDKLRVNASRPWMRYAGMVDSGDFHSSQSIDDVVYGAKPAT